jgi:hypothetical protein
MSFTTNDATNPDANPIDADADPLVAGIVAEFEAREAASASSTADSPQGDLDAGADPGADTPTAPAPESSLPSPPGPDADTSESTTATTTTATTTATTAAPEPIRVLPDPDPAAIVQIAGQDVPLADVEQALGVAAYLQSRPDLLQAVQDVNAGTHVLVPRPNSAASGSGSPAPTPSHAGAVPGTDPRATPTPTPTATPTPAPASPAINPDDYLDPALARQLANVQQSFDQRLAAAEAAYRDQLAQVAQVQHAARQERTAADVQAGRDAFRSRYNFGDAEMQDIENRAAQLQVLPALVEQGRSIADATREAMETAMWSDARYRDALTHQATAAEQATRDDLAVRRNKAASLTGGAQVPRTTPQVDPRQMSSEQRLQAIAQEIANHQSA